MKHIIIGTAGHIDHGKTTLIHALTGRKSKSVVLPLSLVLPGLTLKTIPDVAS